MPKTNLTLQLEVETVARAKVVAARRGTSVSALVARTLDRLVEEDDRYEASRRRAIDLMANAGAQGGPAWTRDELHDR
jgi:hypothetical protein